MHSQENPHPYLSLWEEIKSYFTLNMEYAKLTLAEKVTVLITAAALTIAAFVFCVIILFFLTLAVANWIAEAMPLGLAYAIVAGFYALLLALLVAFRKPLLMNPIARFISRLFLS